MGKFFYAISITGLGGLSGPAPDNKPYPQTQQMIYCTSQQLKPLNTKPDWRNVGELEVARFIFRYYFLAQYYYFFDNGQKWGPNDGKESQLVREQQMSEVIDDNVRTLSKKPLYHVQINEKTTFMQYFWKFILTYEHVPKVKNDLLIYVPKNWIVEDSNIYSPINQDTKLEWQEKNVKPD